MRAPEPVRGRAAITIGWFQPVAKVSRAPRPGLRPPDKAL